MSSGIVLHAVNICIPVTPASCLSFPLIPVNPASLLLSFLPVCLVAEIRWGFFWGGVVYFYFLVKQIPRRQRKFIFIFGVCELMAESHWSSSALHPWRNGGTPSALVLPVSLSSELFLLGHLPSLGAFGEYPYLCTGAPQQYQVENWGISVNIGKI